MAPITEEKVTSKSGVAGRTNYGEWEKKSNELLRNLEEEESAENENAKNALGLNGKYARSEAEAQQRLKSEELMETKKRLENYRERENKLIQTLDHVVFSNNKECFITRKEMEAGKRVLNLSNIEGPGNIILSQDLSRMENTMPTNSLLTPKHYDGDAENEVPNTPTSTILGLIKVSLSELKNCTVTVNCKILTGTIEISHCNNVVVKIENGATISTIQADLSQNLNIQFHNAQSITGGTYWGDSKTDRIFHAGVNEMSVQIYKDGFLESEKKGIDYIKDGAIARGNATAEEVQFVTSLMDDQLMTERVFQTNTNESNSSHMTESEFEEHQNKIKQVKKKMEEHVQKTVKIVSKDGTVNNLDPYLNTSNGEEKIEEVFSDMVTIEIESVKKECELQKKKGNEAFSLGEYAQAAVCYSLALDKATTLKTSTIDFVHILYSNRAACFLKLGHHEKALDDANNALQLEPKFVKALFRKGLAYHAMKQYKEALPVLAEAHKIEPKNKQIKQALQFAEVGLAKEMRSRMNR